MSSATGPSDGPARDGTRILDADDISRVLTRIAHEIVERHQGVDDLVLMGIRTRGVPLAARLAARLAEIASRESSDGETVVPHGSLDVTLYRDDLRRRGPLPLGETRFPCDIDGRTVVLVDDVLYTGRTIRAALEAMAEVGRPSAVRLVVLVDRGHRELPIRADHVGKNLPTARDEDVRVLVAEIDGEDAVELIRSSEEPA
jgi:pyrimidine operon attenuation protein / uracil phosphoribosyltransferase